MDGYSREVLLDKELRQSDTALNAADEDDNLGKKDRMVN